MQKTKYITLLLSCWFFFFTPKLYGQNFGKTDWKLKTSKGNLDVYTRKNKTSNVKEIRIRTSLNASLENVSKILDDVSNYPKWVFKCMEAKKIKINSSSDYFYYAKYDFPFPIVDRDIVVHTKQWKDEKTGALFSNSKATTLATSPEKKGVVRITVLDAYWKITPKSDGTLDIDYIAKTDPGGKLPAWIINLGITKGPIETMKRFRSLVEPQPLQVIK